MEVKIHRVEGKLNPYNVEDVNAYASALLGHTNVPGPDWQPQLCGPVHCRRLHDLGRLRMLDQVVEKALEPHIFHVRRDHHDAHPRQYGD
jgi:hypothetical protein